MAARENKSCGEIGVWFDCLDDAGREGVREAGREGDNGLDITGSLLGV